MSPILSALRHVGSAARGEARLAFLAAPKLLRPMAVIVAWSATAILLGTLVGLAAVNLPPTGTFGIVGAVGLALLWVTPDLPAVPDRIVRRLFFVLLVVDLCIPIYYTLIVPGLPWISARRLVTFPLILLVLLAFAGSPKVRHRVKTILNDNRIIATFVFGYLGTIMASIFTSLSPSATLNGSVAAFLEWYVPFLAILYVVREEQDVLKIVRATLWCALFVTLIGIIEFKVQRNVFVAIMPNALVNALAERNQGFAGMLASNPFRNGMYRASSVYTVSLSFAEFEAMMIPFGYFYLFFGQTARERASGAVLTVLFLAGIFVSGSRGGYLSFFVATVAFVSLWIVRTWRFEPHRMGPAIAVLAGILGVAIVIALVLFWQRAHNIVLGGGMEAYSDEGRKQQWALAWPKILRNPITGYGLDSEGDAVGFYAPGAKLPTVDSGLLSVLIGTGVPGVVCYFGMIIAAAWRGVARFLRDPSREGAMAGAIACALIAYLTYRFFLSQRDNYFLQFILIACALFLDYYYVNKRRETQGVVKRQSPLIFRVRNIKAGKVIALDQA